MTGGNRRDRNVVAEIAARRRGRRGAGARRARPRAGLGAVPLPRRAPRPVAEPLAAPGLAPDRRGQALLAVGRADRAGRRRRRRPGPGLRGRRRRRHLRPVRAALVRRLGRRPARRARCRLRAGAGQGVRRRSAAARPASGPPAPTSSCCWPCLHPAGAWPGSCAAPGTSAWSRSSRPTTRASSTRALATGARLIGINNRDLRTLDVDPERAVRLRDLVPGDRLVDRRVRRPRHRDDRPLARHRVRRGARRRGADARGRPGRGRRRAFVAAGRLPDDPAAADARAPLVKICGVTDAAGILAAVRAGADAIGLNFVPGHAARPRRSARACDAGPPRRGPAARPAADRGRHRRPAGRRAGRASSPPSTPTRSSSAATSRRRRRRRRSPGLEGVRLPAGCRRPSASGRGRAWSRRARAYLAAGAERILLDAAGGPHPGGTGIARRRRRWPPPSPARSRSPSAGGLDPANVGEAVLADPGGRRRRGLRRRRSPRAAGRAPAQGPAPRRAVRQARPRRPPPPAQRRLRPDARPRRACSRSTPPAAGARSATSAGATSPRR